MKNRKKNTGGREGKIKETGKEKNKEKRKEARKEREGKQEITFKGPNTKLQADFSTPPPTMQKKCVINITDKSYYP